MTTLIDRQIFSLQLPDGTFVRPISGPITLDDGGAPYVVATIVIPAPSNPASLDPRSLPAGAQPPRVLLNMTAEYADMKHVTDLTTLYGAGTVAALTTAFGAGTTAALTTLFGASTVWQNRPTVSRNADLAITDFSTNDDGTATLELADDEAYALDAEGVQLATWGAAGVKSLAALVARALAVEMPLQFVPSIDYDLTAAIAATPVQAGYIENLLAGLQTYVDLAGARLWCDENRVWHLDQNIAPLALTAVYVEGFEGGTVAGWTGSNSTLSSSTSAHHSGSRALKMVNTGATGDVISKTLTGLVPGTVYTYSAWFYRGSANDADQVYLFTDTGVYSSNVLPPTGKWTQISLSFTATATSLAVHAYVDFVTPSSTVYWDDILVTTPTIIAVPSTTVRAGQTVTAYTDALSRDTSSSWANLVKIIYSWITSGGVSTQQIDRADGRVPGVPGKQLVIQKDNTPYPGAGAAAASLARTQSYGHEVAVSAVNDFSITPRQNVVVSLPTGDFTGTVSAVTWDIESGDMTITSRNLT